MDKKEIHIQCDDGQITVNGFEINFPVHLNTLKELFGEPSKEVKELVWQVVWDELGVFADYATWDHILGVKFLYANKHQLSQFPNQKFSGTIAIKGVDINQMKETKVELGAIRAQWMTYKGENEAYGIYIGKNFSYEIEIPNDKYTIPTLDEEIIGFQDFGFKLSVIQVLMYEKELLTPKLDVYEFIKCYKIRKIDTEEERFEPIPEVMDYFKQLPVPKRLAKEITEIIQDGGNEVYVNTCLECEGYEDYWDIESIEDAKHFPNLNFVVLCYAKDHILDAFKAKGIEAQWL